MLVGKDCYSGDDKFFNPRSSQQKDIFRHAVLALAIGQALAISVAQQPPS